MAATAEPVMGPQAALEEAAARLVRSELKYDESQCGRQFDGRPPPASGDVYVAVWSRGARESSSQPAARTALDERLGLLVTVTLRLKLPRDRWVEARDDLERRLNAVRALLHRDSHDHRVVRLANQLCGRSQAETRHAGFCEGLAFARLEPLQAVGGEWFASGKGGEAGLAQAAAFERARLVQAIGSAV